MSTPDRSGTRGAGGRLRPFFVVAVLAVAASLSGAFASLDNWLVAKRFELAPRAPTGSIVVVDIDGRSLAEIGQWPWPREIHADLVDRLVAAGAAEIALDIDFSTAATPEGDAALETALERAGGAVILAAFRQVAVDGTEVVNLPLDRFAAHSWPGAVNVEPDGDGRVRSFPFGAVLAGEPVLSIPALLSGQAGDISAAIRVDFSIDADAIDRIPVIDVLDGTVDPDRLRGRKVIVGASATELRDVFGVPRYGFVPGAVLQALATETLLQDRVLQPIGGAAVAGIALALVVLSAVLFRRRRLAEVWLIAAAGVVTIEAVAFMLQAVWAVELPTATLDLAVVALALAALLRELDFRALAAALFRTEAANNRAVLDRVIEDSAAGVIVSGRSGAIIAASVSAARLLDVPRTALAPGLARRGPLPEPLADLFDRATASLAPGDSMREEVRCDRNGDEIILDVTVTLSELHGDGAADAAICMTFADVTQRRREEVRNAYLAHFDPMTGLPNRAHFTQLLKAGLAEDAPHGAVLLFDLDRFKLVNDGLGHRCGDLLLAAAGERATKVLAGRGRVARLSGDEFAIFTHESERSRLAALAREVIGAISAPFDVDGYRIAVGATVGISELGRDGRSVPEIVREADLALNAAKEQGGGHFQFYDASMAASLDRRRQLEVALWDTVEREELEVAYQPQIDLATGALTGVEALARWRHPEFGWVSPADFIPVAEATGLIDRIGGFMLRRACREIAAVSPTLRLAVNVSPLQFARGDVVRTVAEALRDSGLPPERLELEITESLFLSSGSLVARKVDELKELGVSFALDDFGTGYSSLSYLRKLPIAKIKIDRSFVSGLPDTAEAAGIVRAVTAMGKALRIKVNAEGVETAEQADTLRALGCAEGQGYLYGAATGIELLRQRLASGAPGASSAQRRTYTAEVLVGPAGASVH